MFRPRFVQNCQSKIHVGTKPSRASPDARFIRRIYIRNTCSKRKQKKEDKKEEAQSHKRQRIHERERERERGFIIQLDGFPHRFQARGASARFYLVTSSPIHPKSRTSICTHYRPPTWVEATTFDMDAFRSRSRPSGLRQLVSNFPRLFPAPFRFHHYFPSRFADMLIQLLVVSPRGVEDEVVGSADSSHASQRCTTPSLAARHICFERLVTLSSRCDSFEAGRPFPTNFQEVLYRRALTSYSASCAFSLPLLSLLV